MSEDTWRILHSDMTQSKDPITFDGRDWRTSSGSVVLIGMVVVNQRGTIALVCFVDDVTPNGLAIKGRGMELIRR